MIETLGDSLSIAVIFLIPASYVAYFLNQALQKRRKKKKRQAGKYYREW